MFLLVITTRVVDLTFEAFHFKIKQIKAEDAVVSSGCFRHDENIGVTLQKSEDRDRLLLLM